jgi:MGT family glycosyltransferase
MPADLHKWHFGVLSFTGTGHLNPLLSLAQELKHRGHRVTFFEKPKIEDRVCQAGLEFFPIGKGMPLDQKPFSAKGAGILSEASTLRFNLKRISQDLQRFLKETPSALTQAGVNALLVNEVALTGPTVAQMLCLPYFIISTSVPHQFGWDDLGRFSGFRYSSSRLSWVQRLFLELSVSRMRGPILRTLDEFRRRENLGPAREVSKVFPCLSHMTQLPQCLDLPRRSVPGNFCYAGPMVSKSARPSVAFPWDRLDGRPLIYASLGTTRNVQPHVFRQIAEACRNLHVQLIISLGNRFGPDGFADLPGQPLVTQYAPQLEILKIASIVITHCGSNTVFETLMEGKPMIAIPLAYDQPAMAARLARLHLAEVLPVMRLTPRRLCTAITRLLNDTRYRDAAVKMQSVIRSVNGSQRAADVIEDSLDRYAADRPLANHAESISSNCDPALDRSTPVSSLPY